MDEFERIGAIERILAEQPVNASRVALGIGDDASVLLPLPGAQVVSVDSAVEGTHFRFEFGPARLIGRRAAVAALSDLAAMGAVPQAMLTALLIPTAFTDAKLLEVTTGLADASREYTVPLVGGNLSSAQQFSITTTVLGYMEGAILTRGGARPGDTLYCSGPLGGAALGLQLCLREQRTASIAEPALHAYLHPDARIAFGRALVGVATACIDISDGLQQDLMHLCKASAVGAIVEADALPLFPGMATRAEALGLQPLTLALTGGDDYELLFTAPPGRSVPEGARAIGTITPAADGVHLRQGSHTTPMHERGGFQHFRNAADG